MAEFQNSPGFPATAATVRDIIEWDVRNWSGCLAFWSAALRELNPATARVLAVGERNGGISLWFALQGFRVLCTDRGGPTAGARKLHARYEVQHLIEYADVNVFSLPYAADTFDVVTCKSVIGGLKRECKNPATRTLENHHAAICEIKRILKPGGWFLGAENLCGSWLHQKLRQIAKSGSIGWRHQNSNEIRALFSEFSRLEQCSYGFFGTRLTRLGFDRLTGLLDSLVCPWLPPEWLYVCFIRAKK